MWEGFGRIRSCVVSVLISLIAYMGIIDSLRLTLISLGANPMGVLAPSERQDGPGTALQPFPSTPINQTKTDTVYTPTVGASGQQVKRSEHMRTPASAKPRLRLVSNTWQIGTRGTAGSGSRALLRPRPHPKGLPPTRATPSHQAGTQGCRYLVCTGAVSQCLVPWSTHLPTWRHGYRASGQVQRRQPFATHPAWPPSHTSPKR